MINNTSSQIEIDILVDGKPVKQFVHENRFYIQANKGLEYEIRVRNHLYTRILVEFSIDGANPLSGGKSGDGAGYVIGARESYTLKGYRVSDDAVNAFKFSDRKNSYAIKSKDIQDGTNVGVIGVVVHAEKIEQSIKNSHDFWKEWYEKDMNKPHAPIPWNSPVYPYYPPYDPWYDDYGTPIRPWRRPYITWYCSTSESIPNNGTLDSGPNSILRSCSLGTNDLNNAIQCNASQSFQSLVGEISYSANHFDTGTEFSDKEIVDKVKEVDFSKGELLSTTEIFYASRESLLKMGIPLIKETRVSFPSAFPKKYCVKPE